MRIELGRCLLDDCLKKAGLTRADLVKKTGISRFRLSEYASKERDMTLATAYTIAKAIGCSEKALYQRKVVKQDDTQESAYEED